MRKKKRVNITSLSSKLTWESSFSGFLKPMRVLTHFPEAPINEENRVKTGECNDETE